MCSFQNLEVCKVTPLKGGLWACAKYDHWSYEYDFFIHSDGTVSGRTSAGSWVEVTKESAEFIREKARNLLIAKPNLAH
jgi:hypothetical protein